MRKLKIIPLLLALFYSLVAFHLAAESILVALLIFAGASVLAANGLSVEKHL